MKRCPDCGETKPLAEFPRNRAVKDGYAVYCKPCHNAKGRASRDKYGGARKYHLWRRYGLTLDDFNALLTAQAQKCAICGATDPEHVDHDHESGHVRGLLCFNCNGGLGQFKDNASNLRKAAEYLDQAASLPLHLLVVPQGDRRRRRQPPLSFEGDSDVAS